MKEKNEKERQQRSVCSPKSMPIVTHKLNQIWCQQRDSLCCCNLSDCRADCVLSHISDFSSSMRDRFCIKENFL